LNVILEMSTFKDRVLAPAGARYVSQGCSQGSTPLTVVRGLRAQGGPAKVPRRPQEGSQKGSGPGKSCESIGRCSMFLRKRKKIRKRIKVKGS
jgi:hypothetical protein